MAEVKHTVHVGIGERGHETTRHAGRKQRTEGFFISAGASISKGFSFSHSSCIFCSVSRRWSLLAKDYVLPHEGARHFSTNLQNHKGQRSPPVPLLSNTLVDSLLAQNLFCLLVKQQLAYCHSLLSPFARYRGDSGEMEGRVFVTPKKHSSLGCVEKSCRFPDSRECR